MNHPSPLVIAFCATIGFPLFLGEPEGGEGLHEDEPPFQSLEEAPSSSKPTVLEA